MPNRKKFFDQPILITSDLSSSCSTTTGGMQIPFATGLITTSSSFYLNTAATTGAPTQIYTSAFGSIENNSSHTLSGSSAFPILGGTFTPAYNNTCYFCLPCDATIQGIKFTVTYGTKSTAVFTGSTYAFVALATSSDVNKNATPTFTILQESQTITKRPFVQDDNSGYSVSIPGELNGLSIRIPAGTMVAIVCGIFRTDNLTTTQTTYNLNYSGVIRFY